MRLKRIEHWDQVSFCRLFSKSASRLMFALCFWWSKTADGPLYLLIALLLLSFDIAGAESFIQLLLAAFALELPLYLILKNGIKRARPADVLQGTISAHIIPSDRFSLPSGHTAGAFLFALAIIIYFPSLTAIALLWAVGIGLSRIMLGVHFPLDVIAGALLGSSCVVTMYMVFL